MNSKIILCILIYSLCFAGSIFSQNSKKDSRTGINLSIWKGIATRRTDSVGSTCLNIGIFSSTNRLNGLGVNVIGSTVRRGVNGVQVAGLFNLVGTSAKGTILEGNMNGLQVAGIANINGDNMRGVSLSGLVGIAGDHTQGMVCSGLANITGNYSQGIVLGGLLNVTGDESAGFHVAGLGNISGGSFKGISSAGLINVTGENLVGVQSAGLISITADNMTGVQLSGLSNITGGCASGLQLAPVNIAIRAKGLQIGLFNYYKESLEGFQLGLVNANPNTRVQLMLFGGNATKLNIGVRFKNRLFYTILGGGTHYLDFGDKFSAAVFYRAGLELPLSQHLFVSGDLGYQHIETFKNKDYGFPARLYALQARLNLEYRLTDALGLFLTGGYGASRYYTRGDTYDKGLIVEGGVVVFRY